MPAIALASFRAADPSFSDDWRIADALTARGARADVIRWDDPDADWDPYDLVVIRSTWDYVPRRDAYLAWAVAIGERLHNSPAVVRWNSDKRYLGDLAGAGLPVVATTYVDPGGDIPALDGEVVVKPTISAGGRDTGRFGPATHELARDLIKDIHASGRTAMLQPYLADVDTAGETAVACFDGEPSHVLHKKAVLAPDEVAPVREEPDDTGAAEAMYDPDLVTSGIATDDQLALARDVLDHLADRFGAMPLYARVDLVPGPDGAPVVMELEAIEPHFYLQQSPPEALARFADTILARC